MVTFDSGNGLPHGNGHGGGGDSTGTLWAYGYELAPPVPRTRLEGMRAILAAGKAEARTMSRVWEGRFINGDDITHILVVSGSPARNDDINRRLEAELARLDAGYSVSIPVEVAQDPLRRGGWRAGWGGIPHGSVT